MDQVVGDQLGSQAGVNLATLTQGTALINVPAILIVVLISTLGGIQVFGLNGFVIGPVIAATFISVWEISIASRGPDDA